MTPVINPIIFYLIEFADKLNVVGTVFLFIGLMTVVCFTIAYYVTDYEYYEDGLKPLIKKCMTTGVIITLVSSLVVLFIPSSDTVIKMVVAQNVTYERVESATNVVSSVYEDILTLIVDEEE